MAAPARTIEPSAMESLFLRSIVVCPQTAAEAEPFPGERKGPVDEPQPPPEYPQWEIQGSREVP
jgi:hypothetical protein